MSKFVYPVSQRSSFGLCLCDLVTLDPEGLGFARFRTWIITYPEPLLPFFRIRKVKLDQVMAWNFEKLGPVLKHIPKDPQDRGRLVDQAADRADPHFREHLDRLEKPKPTTAPRTSPRRKDEV